MQRLAGQGPCSQKSPAWRGSQTRKEANSICCDGGGGGRGTQYIPRSALHRLPWAHIPAHCSLLCGLGQVPYLCLFPMVKREGNDSTYLLGLCGEWSKRINSCKEFNHSEQSVNISHYYSQLNMLWEQRRDKTDKRSYKGQGSRDIHILTGAQKQAIDMKSKWKVSLVLPNSRASPGEAAAHT